MEEYAISLPKKRKEEIKSEKRIQILKIIVAVGGEILYQIIIPRREDLRNHKKKKVTIRDHVFGVKTKPVAITPIQIESDLLNRLEQKLFIHLRKIVNIRKMPAK